MFEPKTSAPTPVEGILPITKANPEIEKHTNISNPSQAKPQDPFSDSIWARLHSIQSDAHSSLFISAEAAAKTALSIAHSGTSNRTLMIGEEILAPGQPVHTQIS
ncbi:hypothetical protein RRF57_001664 [Xylaria bambusicola]|uniref:Uncharacterized protein n=1 Tax=Xylaria bambusicola TaxID=326684 RepID=A0AAN7UCC2_9PEZI